ncbi:MAG: hypothetical protein L3J59_16055 [Methylococcaceae bacterium]|nr:hypothetical protein [Methylococcaceae bacterium]
MKHSHGNHSMKGMGVMGHSHHTSHTMGKQIIKGSMASASVRSGGKLMGKLAKHPVLVFGIGVVAGYVIYKYRKEIVSNVGKATDASKDFVLQQKENLEDIVSETKEES